MLDASTAMPELWSRSIELVEKSTAGAAPFTLEDLQAFLKDKLGRHEMPQALDIRPALPRTAVGKLSKLELRDEERRKAAEAGAQRGAA